MILPLSNFCVNNKFQVSKSLTDTLRIINSFFLTEDSYKFQYKTELFFYLIMFL
jgi:hypothetical protein